MVNLDKKELEIALLTIEGQKPSEISKKLEIDTSTVYRALKRKNVQEAIARGTQHIFLEVIEKNIDDYKKCQELIGKQLENMSIEQLLKYMNHMKTTIQKFQIDAAYSRFEELKKSEFTEEVIHIEYSDTRQMFDLELKRALREFGITEEQLKDKYYGNRYFAQD